MNVMTLIYVARVKIYEIACFKECNISVTCNHKGKFGYDMMEKENSKKPKFSE
jgi:hypothetical protein